VPHEHHFVASCRESDKDNMRPIMRDREREREGERERERETETETETETERKVMFVKVYRSAAEA
jgi:hypothetical protein